MKLMVYVLSILILGRLYAVNLMNNISLEEDEHLNLTIRFSHSIIKTQWFVNAVPIENTSINYIASINIDHALLIIYNTSIRHSRKYEIQVWDALNQTNRSSIVVHIYSIRKKSSVECNAISIFIFPRPINSLLQQ